MNRFLPMMYMLRRLLEMTSLIDTATIVGCNGVDWMILMGATPVVVIVIDPDSLPSDTVQVGDGVVLPCDLSRCTGKTSNYER